MFPTAYSTIYRNEDGEVTGWDNNSYDEPDVDDFYYEVENDEIEPGDYPEDEAGWWEAEDAHLDGSYEE